MYIEKKEDNYSIWIKYGFGPFVEGKRPVNK